jgi:hypothetical protein
MEEMRKSCKILIEKAKGAVPLRRPRGRQEDNIRMNLREM